MNSVNVKPLGNSFLIFGPKLYKSSIGAAVPNAYPITAPIPPQVAAEAGHGATMLQLRRARRGPLLQGARDAPVG